ncbi:MAG TPA: helix-turn-helix transcriptional regulator [Herpetosiphonaceae bacterium]
MTRTTNPLTPREQEALMLLARGMASQQIASSMCITVGSVQNILQGVRQKLAVDTSIQAVVWAWSQGLVGRDEALVAQ